jgi:hypothetical protein
MRCGQALHQSSTWALVLRGQTAAVELEDVDCTAAATGTNVNTPKLCGTCCPGQLALALAAACSQGMPG